MKLFREKAPKAEKPQVSDDPSLRTVGRTAINMENCGGLFDPIARANGSLIKELAEEGINPYSENTLIFGDAAPNLFSLPSDGSCRVANEVHRRRDELLASMTQAEQNQ